MTPNIIVIDPAERGEATKPAAERLVSGDPRQFLANAYSDPSGRFHAGVWRSSPGAWRVRYTEHEFCYLLEGRVRLVPVQGEPLVLAAGASFVVAAGFEGVWEVVEPAVKLYAIFEPA